MRIVLLFIVSLLAFAPTGEALAARQILPDAEIVVIGMVVDYESKAPIPAANVTVKDLNLGTAARLDGSFIMEIPPMERLTLSFSAVGYRGVERELFILESDTISIRVELHPVAVEMSEVVVTATRIRRTIEDVPVRVEVVPAPEIEEKIAMEPSSVSMLVSELPGVRLQTTSATSGAVNLRIQGLSGRYTQLLTDGIPIFGGMEGAFGLLQLPPLNLHQVEVVKGASSVLYGADAIAGVVNFITKIPKEEPELTFLANRTTQRGLDLALYYSQLVHHYGMTLLATRNTQDMFDVDGDGFADIAEFKRYTVRPKFVYSPHSDVVSTFSVGFTTEDRLGGAVSAPYRESIATRRWDAAATFHYQFPSDRALTAKVAGVDLYRSARYGGMPFVGVQRLGYAEAQYSFELGQSTIPQTILIGGAFSFEDFSDKTPDEAFDRSYRNSAPAIFVQDELRISPLWTLLLSGRLDFHNRVGTFVTPRAAVMFRPEYDLTFRLGGGTGFKAPTIFTEGAETSGFQRVYPTASVSAEKAQSVSFDVNYRKLFGQLGTSLNASLFLTRVKNAVRENPDSLDAGAIYLENAGGRLLTRGGEFLLRLTLSDFRFTISYTYVYATRVEDGREIEQPLTPRHSLGGVFVWENHEMGARIGIESYFSSRQLLERNPFRSRSPGYLIFGVHGEKEFGGVRLFANAENLFDRRPTRYDPLVLGGPQVGVVATLPVWAPVEGRVFNVGVKVSF